MFTTSYQKVVPSKNFDGTKINLDTLKIKLLC